MQERQSAWGDLHVGAYFREDGVTWKIEKERDLNYLGVNREGERRRFTPRDPRTPVTMLVPTEEEANGTLQKLLGAVKIGERATGAKGWSVEAFPTKSGPGVLEDCRSHLFMFHGVWAGDVKTLVGLIECHEETHRDPMKGHQDHTHAGGNPA